jgi:hypothetical protein
MDCLHLVQDSRMRPQVCSIVVDLLPIDTSAAELDSDPWLVVVCLLKLQSGVHETYYKAR